MKWISVKDKLPEEGQEVLVCYESQFSGRRYGYGVFNFITLRDSPTFEIGPPESWEIDKVMFWAKVEPPKGEE